MQNTIGGLMSQTTLKDTNAFVPTSGAVIDYIHNISMMTQSKIYYVFKGGDGTTGLSWETAFTTLTAAIIAQRAWRDTIPAAQKSVATYIIMAPATYNEAITSFPMSTKIIGLGHLGTDKCTEIFPDVGSPMAGTASGLGLYNIRFRVKTTAVDCLDWNIFNNGIIDGCEFITYTGDAVNALSTEDCQNTIIRNCRVFDQNSQFFTNGFYFAGGANKYLQGCLIENNFISGLDPTGTGIFIQSTCTCTDTIIRNNVITLRGAGKGIDDDSGDGGAIILNNFVYHVSGAAYDIGNMAANNIDKDTASAPVWNPAF